MVTTVPLDIAFSCVKKDCTGFFVWRVENLQIVLVPKEQFGRFHRGDSYIVYSASRRGKAAGLADKPGLCLRPSRSPLEIHIHFWLGSETSPDEAGLAALKTVELDVALGGVPVQHRELEAHESKRFLSYFKDEIRYLNWGISSGLYQVKNEFKPSLYRVKGKRTMVVDELPLISWNSMSQAGVFVLDCWSFIYVWIGCYSNKHEKLLGAKLATKLKNHHGESQVVIVEDGQEEAMNSQIKDLFQQHLPLHLKHHISEYQTIKEDPVMRRLTTEIKLFRCSEDRGTLKVTEVKNGPFSQRDLDSNASYILDMAPNSVWVWVGRRAFPREREEAMRNAQGFISKKGYPSSTWVTRVIEGGEPPEFKSLFAQWKEEEDETIGFVNPDILKKAPTTVQTKFDAATLYQRPDLSAQTQMVDDGLGQREIWRLENLDLIAVSEEAQGEFFSSHCYIVLYAYSSQAAENYVIYYWIGQEAGEDEASAAAIKAAELDSKLRGRAVLGRVTQGDEPPHFIALFGGKMIVYEGLSPPSDGSIEKFRDKKPFYMLQVTGNTDLTTKAIEVDMKASSLNSSNCFVVVTPFEILVWCGRGSTGDERETAKRLAKTQGDPVLISEGHEKDSFWKILGGRRDYGTCRVLKNESPNHPPRLYQCSNASGAFTVEEIFNFNQSDLVEDDVMLLDAWNALFIWIGRYSHRQEQRESEYLVLDYLKTDPAGRSLGTAIIKVKQGFEPPNFTGFFASWDSNLWHQKNHILGDILIQLQEIAPSAVILVTPTDVANGGPSRTYPISTLLISDQDKLPKGVDPTRKEDFLCESDFIKAFGIGREAYWHLPQWKRLNLKKKAGLF